MGAEAKSDDLLRGVQRGPLPPRIVKQAPRREKKGECREGIAP